MAIRFPEPSNAYQALSVLKQADAEGRIELRAAAVVERTREGQLRIPEGADNVGLEGTASGGLNRDARRHPRRPAGDAPRLGDRRAGRRRRRPHEGREGEDALSMLGSAISPARPLSSPMSPSPRIEVVDGEMAKLSGEVTRRPVDDVMAELEAAEAATEAAAKEARQKMRAQRKAEVSEKFSERVGKLKERLGISTRRPNKRLPGCLIPPPVAFAAEAWHRGFAVHLGSARSARQGQTGSAPSSAR